MSVNRPPSFYVAYRSRQTAQQWASHWQQLYIWSWLVALISLSLIYRSTIIFQNRQRISYNIRCIYDNIRPFYPVQHIKCVFQFTAAVVNRKCFQCRKYFITSQNYDSWLCLKSSLYYSKWCASVNNLFKFSYRKLVSVNKKYKQFYCSFCNLTEKKN